MAIKQQEIIVENDETMGQWCLIVWCDNKYIRAIRNMLGVATLEAHSLGGYYIWIDHRYVVAEVADEIRALANAEIVK